MSSRCMPSVAIIGAGLAGISTAIALKTQLNFDNFVIYEKANAVGGTWRDSTYPGCGSDVGIHWYSLSTELNPYWPSYYASQPEIQAYWMNLWRKYKLESHTKLGHLVRYAEWDETTQRYHLKVENVATGETTESDAEIIFYAIGGFISPAYPKDIQGIGTFRGDAWHSAKWNHDVDLRGKRVGVVGNGCSASQFIPEISKDSSTTVVNFIRTPQWYSPRTNIRYPAWLQWVFAHVPFIMRLYRNFIVAKADLMSMIFQKKNTTRILGAKLGVTNYMTKMAPKEYLDKLIPSYSVGCKRLVVDHGYLECLHRPNVSLRWEGIESIVQEGIKLKTGEMMPLDVIIFGTGYSLVTGELTIRGSKGLTLAEFNQQHGGNAAYLGTCRPGFPNLFHVLGPNTATGHASVIFTEEVQINYAIQMVKAIIDDRVRSFEVKESACEEYDGWLQRRLSTSVWTECNSFYQVGNSKDTKNTAMFPGPIMLFWWMLRQPDWGQYEVRPGRGGGGHGYWVWAAVAAAVGGAVVYL